MPMTTNPPLPISRLLAVCLAILAACFLAPGEARAQTCSSNGISPITFGTLNANANTDVTTNANFSCWGGGNQPTYYSMCLYISADGTPTQDGGHRRLQGWKDGDSTIYYVSWDLFRDSSRSDRLGNQLASSAAFSATTPTEATTSFSRTLYARAFPPPPGAPAITYSSYGMQATVQYAWSHSSTPSSCSTTPTGGGQGSFNMTLSGNTTANVANTCQLGTATSMSFGPAASLGSARDQTSTITLACPSGTAWRVALSNGNYHSGTTRRMSGPGGYVSYELYKDSNRTTVWGNVAKSNDQGGSGTGGSETLTVYGRVPAQANQTPGTYSDTVTVTLTY